MGVWTRVRVNFWASTNPQLQLGYFMVDPIVTLSTCNCTQVYTSIPAPFAPSDSPVIRVFINGFDVSSLALQISVSPSNLQQSKLTVSVTVGASTVLRRIWLSWLAFSPSSASFGSFGGQYSQSRFSGSVNRDISNTLYQSPYVFLGINLIAISNTLALAFTSAVDSGFVLSVSASGVVDDFSLVYIAVGVPPSRHCSSCGSGLVASGNNCLASCGPGSFAFTYKDGGVACKTCSSKLGQILVDGKCVPGSNTTSSATTTINSNAVSGGSSNLPATTVPPVVNISNSVIYSQVPTAQ